MLEAIILVCMLYSQQEKKSLLEFTIRKITKQNFFFQDLLAFWRGDTNFHPALVVSATAYWNEAGSLMGDDIAHWFFYHIEPLKNKPSLILPSTIARNS